MGQLSSFVRRAGQMIFQRYPTRLTMLGRLGDERDYVGLVGDGSMNSIVQMCLSFIINGFSQMYPVVVKSERDDIETRDVLAAHKAAVLFRRPSFDPDLGYSWMTWMQMISGVLISYLTDGNGYILKVRSEAGIVVQLWYVPHFMLEPRWAIDDPTRFITCYDYNPFGGGLTPGPTGSGAAIVYPVPVRDIIHIRYGIDPNNTRKGFAPLKAGLREVFTDEEAARFTASLLRNNGVPGIVVSPASDKWIADDQDAIDVKARIERDFGGDNRGKPIVMRGPTKVEQYGFSPEAMKLADLRATPETRITGLLNVPASVVGVLAGLEMTKVGATMGELIDLGWQNGILPPSRVVAAALTEQLVSEFESGAAITHDFAFDTSRVPIMSDYNYKLAQKHEVLFGGGLERRAEGRRALGLKAGPRDEVYLLQAGASEVDATKSVEDAPGPSAAAAIGAAGATASGGKPGGANGNGNGHGHGAPDPVKDTAPVA